MRLGWVESRGYDGPLRGVYSCWNRRMLTSMSPPITFLLGGASSCLRGKAARELRCDAAAGPLDPYAALSSRNRRAKAYLIVTLSLVPAAF